MPRYRERGYLNPSLPVIECIHCYALLVDDTEGTARAGHDNLHDRLEAALSAAQGYPS